jgi:drug/metabolite transporter (DMT)-like permease
VTNPLAVVFALGAAVLFGWGNAVEHRVATEMSNPSGLSVVWVARLARERRWQLGWIAQIGGFGLHAAALAYGGLLLVQPLLACGLLFALPLSARWSGQSLRRQDWFYALLLCAGLSTFLIAAAPSGGLDSAPASRWLGWGVPVLVLAAGLVIGAIWSRGRVRAALLGCAAGACFGIEAALTKTFVGQIQRGVPYTASHWHVYALALTALTGIAFIQNAFQTDSLSASLPGLEVSEPLVAVFLGATVYHEHIQGRNTASNVLTGVSILVMLYAIIRLAQSAGTIGAHRTSS